MQNIQSERQADRQATASQKKKQGKQTDRQIDIHTIRWAYLHTYIHTRQIHKETGSKTDTGRQTYKKNAHQRRDARGREKKITEKKAHRKKKHINDETSVYIISRLAKNRRRHFSVVLFFIAKKFAKTLVFPLFFTTHHLAPAQ